MGVRTDHSALLLSILLLEQGIHLIALNDASLLACSSVGQMSDMGITELK